MKKIYLSFIVLLFAVLLLSGCAGSKGKTLSFAFYNVENLFDTINNPNTKDDRFLPGSELHWNSEKYNKKLNNTAKVIASICETGLPDILGLSEVENINVVKDLLKTDELKNSGYKIIHKDSPDERGLDEALLYKPSKFKLVSDKYIYVDFPFKGYYSKAYILYVKGLTQGGDTLHVFVNHWISRWKGKKETDIYRELTADKLRNIVNKIMDNDPNANILIAGDFNDNPTDKSVKNELGALKPDRPLRKKSLYNLALKPFKKGEGTVFNSNGWDMFDQIIVSTSLLTGSNGLQVNSAEQKIIKHPWMMTKNDRGEEVPFRTATDKYSGGYSDHLPVCIEMTIDDARDVSSIISINFPVLLD